MHHAQHEARHARVPTHVYVVAQPSCFSLSGAIKGSVCGPTFLVCACRPPSVTGSTTLPPSLFPQVIVEPELNVAEGHPLQPLTLLGTLGDKARRFYLLPPTVSGTGILCTGISFPYRFPSLLSSMMKIRLTCHVGRKSIFLPQWGLTD